MIELFFQLKWLLLATKTPENSLAIQVIEISINGLAIYRRTAMSLATAVLLRNY